MTQDYFGIQTLSLTVKSASYSCGVVKKLWWNAFLRNDDGCALRNDGTVPKWVPKWESYCGVPAKPRDRLMLQQRLLLWLCVFTLWVAFLRGYVVFYLTCLLQAHHPPLPRLRIQSEPFDNPHPTSILIIMYVRTVVVQFIAQTSHLRNWWGIQCHLLNEGTVNFSTNLHCFRPLKLWENIPRNNQVRNSVQIWVYNLDDCWKHSGDTLPYRSFEWRGIRKVTFWTSKQGAPQV